MPGVVPCCVSMPDVDEDVREGKACFDIDDAYVEELRSGKRRKVGNMRNGGSLGGLLTVRRPNCISAIFCLIGSYLW